MCVAGTSRRELVFLMLKTGAGTSDVVGNCDSRHVCDDEESHHEDLVKVNMSLKTTMTTGQVLANDPHLRWTCFVAGAAKALDVSPPALPVTLAHPFVELKATEQGGGTVTAASVLLFGKQFVGRKELCTGTGVFETLAGWCFRH